LSIFQIYKSRKPRPIFMLWIKAWYWKSY